jgi:hypothetical protein
MNFKDSSKTASIEGLGRNIARLVEQGYLRTTAVLGMYLFRRTEPAEPISGMYEPRICRCWCRWLSPVESDRT